MWGMREEGKRITKLAAEHDSVVTVAFTEIDNTNSRDRLRRYEESTTGNTLSMRRPHTIQVVEMTEC